MTALQPSRLPRSAAQEEAPTLGKLAPTARAQSVAPHPGAAPLPPEPATHPLLPRGLVLSERYTVLHPLGHGGMSLVLAAYDARLSRRVALKLLRPRWSLDDSESQVRLLREAQSMARLSHPNVVQVYDSGRHEDESVFIAMEYVEGQTLRQWLRAAAHLARGAARSSWRRARAWRRLTRRASCTGTSSRTTCSSATTGACG